MPKPVDLSFAFGLPPEKAIEYFRAKGYEISWDWRDVWREAHAKAFTVAKATRMDILQDIREMVDKALAEGISFEQFKKELEPRLKAKGWWGYILQTNPKTGQMERVLAGSPWRLQTIFRTNLQSAYMAGRYKQLLENADNRPFWQYVAVLDSRTRPKHRALHGKVFRADDPIWLKIYPPNGFNCFPEGTVIATPAGWKEINDLQVGDLVIGGSGKNRLITAVHRTQYNGKLLRIITERISDTATPNHRFLTIAGWKRADELRVGDVLVQLRKVAALNKSIKQINHSNTLSDNSTMPLPGKGEPIIADTLNAQSQIGNININPKTPDAIIEDDLKPSTLEKIYESFLIFARLSLSVRVLQGILGIPANLSNSHLLSNFWPSSGGDNFKLLCLLASRGVILLSFPKPGMPSFFFPFFNLFFEPLRLFPPSIIVVKPLHFNGLSASTRFDSEMFHEFDNRMGFHIPPILELSIGHQPLDIEPAEGYISGAPLDGFDSLESFRAWALSHATLHTVRCIQTVPYNGNVYNLTIEQDESYCVRSAIVHNCRCRVRALTEKQLKAKGLQVETGTQDLESFPDPGFDFNPGAEMWKPDFSRYAADLQKIAAKLEPGLLKQFPVEKWEDVQPLMEEFAKRYPGYFARGFKEITREALNPGVIMQTNCHGIIRVSTRPVSGLVASEDLLGGLSKIARDGKFAQLTFNEEYAIESLWHEILHNTALNPIAMRRNTMPHIIMETINQFVARYTYNDFMEILGGVAQNQERIIREGIGYRTYLTNFHTLLRTLGLDPRGVLSGIRNIHLNTRWDDQWSTLIDFLKEHSPLRERYSNIDFENRIYDALKWIGVNSREYEAVMSRLFS